LGSDPQTTALGTELEYPVLIEPQSARPPTPDPRVRVGRGSGLIPISPAAYRFQARSCTATTTRSHREGRGEGGPACVHQRL